MELQPMMVPKKPARGNQVVPLRENSPDSSGATAKRRVGPRRSTIGFHAPVKSWLIHPYGSFKTRWNLFMTIFIFYSAIIFPYRVGFSADPSDSENIVDRVIDCLFALDIALTFNTCVVRDRELVYDRKLIAADYMKGFLVLDILSTVPLDVMLNSVADNLVSLKLLRLMRLLKLARLLKVKRLFTIIEDETGINPSMLNLVQLLLYILFLAHILACLWYYVGDSVLISEGESWISYAKLQDDGNDVKYLSSLYWAMTTLATIGYGDIRATGNEYEMMMCIVTEMLGSSVFGYIIANISVLLESFDARAKIYDEKMREVKNYLKETGLPPLLSHKIKRYYAYYLERKSLFNEDAILDQMSDGLRIKFLLHLHESTIKQVDLLKNNNNKEFLAAIVSRLKPLYLLVNTYIIRQGDVGKEMFFLLKGVCEVVISKNEGGQLLEISIGYHKAGSYFGEISLLNRQARTASVIAATHCDVVSLSKNDLDRLFDAFPEQKEGFQDNIKLRLREIEALKATKKVVTAEIIEKNAGSESPSSRARRLDNSDNSKKQDSKPHQRLSLQLDPAISEQLLNGGRGKGIAALAQNTTNSIRHLGATSPPKMHRAVSGGDLTVDEKVSVTKKSNSHLSEQKGTVDVRRSSLTQTPDMRRKSVQIALPVTSDTFGVITTMEKAKNDRLSSTKKSLNKQKKTLFFESDTHRTSSFAETVKNNSSDADGKRRFFLMPLSKPKVYWDFLLASIILYSVTVMPIRLAFELEAEGGVAVFENIIDVLFGVDILVSFRTAYISVHTDQLVTKPRLIAAQYLRSWFIIDFLSTVPLDSVMQVFAGADTDTGGNLSSLKFARVLRLGRLIKLVRLLKLGKVMEDLEDYVEEIVSPGFIQLFKLFFQVAFIAHILGCMFFLIPTFTESNNNWRERFHVNTYPLHKKYIVSLYWAFTTMTTVGYGDIVPISPIEKIYAIFCMLIGVTLFGYIVGSMARIVSKLNESMSRQKEHLDVVKHYLKEKKCTGEMRIEVLRYFEYILSRKSMFDEAQILNELSEQLRNEILVCLYKDLLRTIPFIAAIDDPSSLATVVSSFTNNHYSPGDFIVKSGDIGMEMYLVAKGEIEIVSGDDLDDVMETFTEGAYFGEMSVLHETVRTINVRSVGYSTLLSLSKMSVDVWRVDYPEFAEKYLKDVEATVNKHKALISDKSKKLLSGSRASLAMEITEEDDFQEREDKEGKHGGIASSSSLSPPMAESTKKAGLNTPKTPKVKEDSGFAADDVGQAPDEAVITKELKRRETMRKQTLRK